MWPTRVLAPALALFFATTAFADEDEFGAALPPITRYTLALPLPVPAVIVDRAGAGAATGITYGAAFEARINHGVHGALVGVGFVGGPRVGYFDVAYSALWTSTRRLRGFSGAASVDVGPSFAVVGETTQAAVAQNGQSTAPPIDVPRHATLGGRLSFHADLLYGPMLAGIVLGYRGGAVLLDNADARWEGIVFFGFEIGIVRQR